MEETEEEMEATGDREEEGKVLPKESTQRPSGANLSEGKQRSGKTLAREKATEIRKKRSDPRLVKKTQTNRN